MRLLPAIAARWSLLALLLAAAVPAAETAAATTALAATGASATAPWRVLEFDGADGVILYGRYRVPVATGSVLVIATRTMLPQPYLVVDLDTGAYRVYSPYDSHGLLHASGTATATSAAMAALVRSERMRAVPEQIPPRACFDCYEGRVLLRHDGAVRRWTGIGYNWQPTIDWQRTVIIDGRRHPTVIEPPEAPLTELTKLYESLIAALDRR